MFYCDRCGSSYKATAVSSASCPRCQANGAPDTLLKFRLFESSALAVAGVDPRGTRRARPGSAAERPDETGPRRTE